MIIIYGTRQYFRTKRVTQSGFCPNCDNFAKLRSFNAMKFFHLYYLPFIPIQSRKRTHQMCSKCSFGTTYALADYEKTTNALKEKAADAILAVQNGELMLASPELGLPPMECVPGLIDIFEWIYAAGDADFCQGMLGQLSAPNCRYAQSMLTGKLETMKGNLDAAIQAFMDASAADPKSALAHQMRAHLLTQRRRPDEAIGAYQTALSLTADPRLQLAINAQMVDQLMATKRFADAAATYDRIIALRPDLAQNPTIAKGMKKAKKQAGLA